jgi:hypothetical protein
MSETDLPFRKSSYSGSGNNCVEVADAAEASAVRDSQHPGAGHLWFASAEWTAFLDTAKGDQL